MLTDTPLPDAVWKRSSGYWRRLLAIRFRCLGFAIWKPQSKKFKLVLAGLISLVFVVVPIKKVWQQYVTCPPSLVRH